MANENLKEMALEALRSLQKLDDTEMAHVEADKVLCSLLEFEGYEEVVELFNKLKKWYA
jgi:hypothetical protein